ncbi:MAG: alanine--tRNA ligase [bacterium]|nr:alanine--tRNA ligase [bacterium]
MNSRDIRDSFLDYFERHGHRIVASAPLVPHDDRTLLFTNAGMVPFKNFFLGAERPPAPRAVSVQKCMRVSGKHNDLENVGPSHRHHTFFEMLGNFSFGDYFKADAIRYGWELVTEGWGIEPSRLYATVFEEDDEAAELWKKVSGLQAERVLRCGAKDNFWAMGDTGPCGPCSEIFVDMAPAQPPVAWKEGSESGRYLEIWNLVFMQFERQADGELKPLPNPSIDTGAGLERVAAVLQGVESNYDSDLFSPILCATSELAGVSYGNTPNGDVAMRVIADHLRAVGFLLADGVIPSNEGRGYVLRRILRRAVRHGMSLGFEDPFLGKLLPVVSEVMGEAYPELGKAQAGSVVTLATEERKFLETLATGSRRVQDAIEKARAAGSDHLDGGSVFRLYDTFGLPLETIREIAEEEQIGLDETGFNTALNEQRERSRAAADDAHKLLGDAERLLLETVKGETAFCGYERLKLDQVPVLALTRTEGEEAELTESLTAGQEGIVVFPKTPFYAEAGGQIGDRGRLLWPGGTAEVVDVQREKGVSFHLVKVISGELSTGDRVEAEVDAVWRKPTQRNHTATHLLHAALRHVLGEGVRQAGSLVAPDRLRFDFTFGRPLEPEELATIEQIVNDWVLEAQGTETTAEREFEEAVAAGAMALFGEKYGERVRTVAVPTLDLGANESVDSLELCGGCHVSNTGEIGLFVITSERGVASGVRRIEARTGDGARQLAVERARLLQEAAGTLSVAEARLPEEVAALAGRQRELEREVSKLRMKMISGAATGDREIEIEGVKVLAREVPAAPINEIRSMADVLKARIGSGVVVLGTREAGKVHLVAAVSQDLVERVHAGKLAGAIAAKVGGRGGGRAEFAQAGGKDPDELPKALESVPELVREQLLSVGAGA